MAQQKLNEVNPGDPNGKKLLHPEGPRIQADLSIKEVFIVLQTMEKKVLHNGQQLKSKKGNEGVGMILY